MRQARRELGKLIAYAKGHGIAVYFHDSVDGGGWTFDGKEIFISAKRPLAQYLVLLHELAHHRQFLLDGKTIPPKIEKAMHKETYAKADEIIDKKYRKILYDAEKNDSKHQLDIHYETQSTIPIILVKLEIELDLWAYKCYYRSNFPTRKKTMEKRKELRKKYGL